MARKSKYLFSSEKDRHDIDSEIESSFKDGAWKGGSRTQELWKKGRSALKRSNKKSVRKGDKVSLIVYHSDSGFSCSLDGYIAEVVAVYVKGVEVLISGVGDRSHERKLALVKFDNFRVALQTSQAFKI